ncbi:MAG: four helix bundle protein [Bacteroidales bacterium]|jgi:four helix bundle protein|nr:four helix bundle protein [Bacteroidales bacterium]
MRNDKQNIIVEKSFQFALEIVLYCELLEENKKYVLSKQLLRAGTSIGANVREAQNAESKADFIHKLKLAAKEADETEYWLLICKHTPTYPFYEKLLIQIHELMKILSKIISSSKSN